jgi:dethiobiotin synthetase
MTRIVFIGGTGMGVGKTTLVSTFARALQTRGRRVVAIKAVEAWCDRGPPGAEDGERLAEATGQSSPRQALVRYRPTLVPPMAADMEQAPLDWNGLIDRVRTAASGTDVALVEGAGGLSTPLTWDHDNLSLARALSAPLLLLAPDHIQGSTLALMALAATREAQVPLLGLAFSVSREPDPTTGAQMLATRRFAKLPPDRTTTIRSLPDNPSEALDMDAIRKVADWLEHAEPIRVPPRRMEEAHT